MNNVALLVAALEGHGIRLYLRGNLIDVRSDDLAVEKEPISLLDALTRSKADVLVYLRDRETPQAPVRVTDTRPLAEPVSTPSAAATVDPDAPAACEYDPIPHRHDRVGGECLTAEGWQAVRPPGWRRPARFAHIPLFPTMAMPDDYRELRVRAQGSLKAQVAYLNALTERGR